MGISTNKAESRTGRGLERVALTVLTGSVCVATRAHFFSLPTAPTYAQRANHPNPSRTIAIQFIRETGGIELMKTLNFVLGHAVVNRSMPDEPPGIPPEHCGKFYFFVELTQRIALTEAEA